MATQLNRNKVIRSLSILLCALFLGVSLAKDFRSKSKSNSSYFETLSSQQFNISVVKGLQLFPVNEPTTEIASATSVVRGTNKWKSVPKALLVSLSERNSFYITATINAP